MVIRVSVQKTVPEISREYGIAEQTFYKWQQKYGSMKVSEVQKMKSLKEENAKLKRLTPLQFRNQSLKSA